MKDSNYSDYIIDNKKTNFEINYNKKNMENNKDKNDNFNVDMLLAILELQRTQIDSLSQEINNVITANENNNFFMMFGFD